MSVGMFMEPNKLGFAVICRMAVSINWASMKFEKIKMNLKHPW